MFIILMPAKQWHLDFVSAAAWWPNSKNSEDIWYPTNILQVHAYLM